MSNHASPSNSHRSFEDPNDVDLSTDDVLEVIEADPNDGDFPMEEDEDEEVPNLADRELFAPSEDVSSRFEAHFPNPVYAVACHPIDDDLVVSGGEDEVGWLWSIEACKVEVEAEGAQQGEERKERGVVKKLDGHTDTVTAVGFSPDGDWVATGGMDGRVQVWQHDSSQQPSYRHWNQKHSLQGPEEVTSIEWHPTGPVLLVAGSDGIIWMWHIPSGQTMNVFTGGQGSISALKWTPDGKHFASASTDSSLLFWNPKDPSNPLFRFMPSDARFFLEGGITSLSINQPGTTAVVGGAEDGGVRVVNLVNGNVIGGLEGHGKSGKGGTVGQQDEDEEERAVSIEAVQFATLGGSGVECLVTADTDGKVNVWEGGTLKLRGTGVQPDAISSLSLYGDLFATGSADGSLSVWDLRSTSGKPIKTLNQAPTRAENDDDMAAENENESSSRQPAPNQEVIHALSWTPNGKYLVAAGEDGTVCAFGFERMGPTMNSRRAA